MHLFRSKLLLLTLFLLISSSVFAQNTDCLVNVTFLHVNDVYQFAPVDDGARGGLARLLTLKRRFKDKYSNLIFTMGGDTISPSVESRTYKGAQMIDAWNAVGIDYAVFGNHEFDVKTEVLLQRMKESKFQWLGANVFDKNTQKIFADTPPFVVREFDGVKVGIIGFLLPDTKDTSSMEKNLDVLNICDTAKKYVPQMRAAGVKTVVGLTHLSMREDKDLAKCADFDLILGGHEHTLLQSSSNGTPIFKMSADARELGRFTLNINKKTGEVENMDWEIIPVTDAVDKMPEFKEAAAEFGKAVAKYDNLLVELAKPVGATSETLDARPAGRSYRCEPAHAGER